MILIKCVYNMKNAPITKEQALNALIIKFALFHIIKLKCIILIMMIKKF